MKKFLSAILSFAMIFALSIPAFAADITVVLYQKFRMISIINYEL